MIEPTDEMFQALLGRTVPRGLEALLAIINRDYDVRPREVVHTAVKGDSHMHCCGIELIDLPRGHRWTLDPHAVTCKGPS